MPDTLTLDETTAAQRQARIDLAAAHRLAVEHGFSEGIFNHLTLAVPGKTDRYYQIPFGLHWSEVNASCLESGDHAMLRSDAAALPVVAVRCVGAPAVASSFT